MARSFRFIVMTVILVYLVIASLFGVGITVLSIQRSKYVDQVEKYYNTTLITITGYKVIPGICVTCVVIPPIPPARNQENGLPKETNFSDPNCYTRPGYYAYATISYDVWLPPGNNTGNVVKYQGETPNNEWCDTGPGSAVQHAESVYGDIGSVYNGYYLLKTPTEWYWYIPGHRHYVEFIVVLSICVVGVFVGMICHLAILCRIRKYRYKPLQ